VLASLRTERQLRDLAGGSVAVLADPVFSSDDERVSAARASSKHAEKPADNEDARRSSEFALNGVTLRRLDNSRKEAEAIRGLFNDALIATDFAANLHLAKDPSLGHYRIVHFATHGLLDSKCPELSSIALSLVDQSGKTQSGFLTLSDIYNLRLSADLVVLS